MAKSRKQRRPLPSDPTRDMLLNAMKEYGLPISQAQAARAVGRPPGTVAYHMAKLVEAGHVVVARKGPARGTQEHFFVLVGRADGRATDVAAVLLRLCNAQLISSRRGEIPVTVPIDSELRADLDKLAERIAPQVHAAARRSLTRAGGISVGRKPV